ncbi:MAG TPA: hemerythrin domain-containing protein [Caldimonas sp.]
MNLLLKKLSPTATNLIRMDHTHVLAAFHQYEADIRPQTKKVLVNTVSVALEIHVQLEEEIFYPALRRVVTDPVVIDKSVPEHGEMRRLIAKLREMEPIEVDYDRTFMELMRDVMHHVADEETVLLPAAERMLADELEELGAKMVRRRLELVAPRAGEIAANSLRSLPASAMWMSAGAVLAGSLMLRRAFRRRA